MTTRTLSIFVAILAVAAALVIVLAGGSDDDGEGGAGARLPDGPVAQTLRSLGQGPGGSAPVALTRWRYRSDRADRGREKGWAKGRFPGREVTVPYAPNARSVQGARAERAYAGSIGWYARDIEVPVAGRYAVAFESAHHTATIYVDGRRVRSHLGAYEPFTARPALTAGRHTVVARVDWRDPSRQAAQGFKRAWFNYGGLNRPVTLSRLGDFEIGALKLVTTLREGNARVRIRVRVRNRGARTQRARIVASLARGGRTIPLRFATRAVPAGRSVAMRTTVSVDEPELWSPRRPALYRLLVEVPGSARLSRPVGLRELRWDGGGLRLNEQPLILRGASVPPDARDSGDALSADDEERVVAQLRATGANATRSQLPLSRSLLGRLDAAGILVWQEIGPFEPAGAWSARTPQAIAAARTRALRVAEAQQAHPSILTWTLANEVSGSGRIEQQDYVRQTAAALHKADPTRPVAVDLWGRHLTKRTGGMFDAVDALGVTDYMGWYEGIDFNPDGQDEVVRKRLEGLRTLFADKPIVVTELGAAGTERIPDQDFGGVRFQADLLARRIGVLREIPGLSGALVWSLRDYALRPDFRGGSVLKLRPELDLTPGLNEKGLFDFRGREKPALAAVRDAFAGG